MPERKNKLPPRFACGNAPTGSGARVLSKELLIFLGPRSSVRCVNRRTNFGLDAQTLFRLCTPNGRFCFHFGRNFWARHGITSAVKMQLSLSTASECGSK